ncbi:rab-GTPase-TBC domain protein (macronuclear) [Tetrahymena thermophila SB210]|uniref:Rab-GTPase-TBC domain protein n=1 Tax=Tetrahymena thermophila (strain SB210) TaxID=312017 RepID=Q239N5_TETTS|nr:rab-GTPase-TBC domain protein [Tetrahymena thermophila SB210]EAR93235.2 rab-GTPase-TBC domain protein [Tetrahymena thermophila SB210]|eukprot:XP_001013480.2 rab-GTPase-TBC domain protein [Tetrahymena thermophila SB210]
MNMNKSIQSKSNPRTPINQRKYSQHFYFQNPASQQKNCVSGNNDQKTKGFNSNEGQHLVCEQQEKMHQIQFSSNSSSNDIFFSSKNNNQLNLDLMNHEFVDEENKIKQSFVQNAACLPQNYYEIASSKSSMVCLTTPQNPQKRLQKNPSAISIYNDAANKSNNPTAQKNTQENIFNPKKLQNNISAKNSSNISALSSINISNYTSEQIQKNNNISVAQFQLQPSQDQNILFKELIGFQQQKSNEIDTKLNGNYPHFQQNLIQASSIEADAFLKRHSPIQQELPNKGLMNNGVQMNSGGLDGQDYSQFLKENKNSSKNMLNIQKNYQHNASKTPQRKISNTSKVSLNATPSNQSTISYDNQKKKSSQKSTLKLIQDSSSYNSYVQQQKQQNQCFQIENPNNKFQYISNQDFKQQQQINQQQNPLQIQQKYNNLCIANQKNNSSSQHINPMSSISIQSQNSLSQNQLIFQNQFEHFQIDQGNNNSQQFDKQFYSINQRYYGLNNEQLDKENVIHQHDNEIKHSQDINQEKENKFSRLNSSKSTNLLNYKNSNNQENPSNLFDKNKSNHLNHQIKLQNQNENQLIQQQKPPATQEEDYSVPQELQNSFQMNKNMSKLNVLTTIRASEIDLLKGNEKTNQSQLNTTNANRYSIQNTSPRADQEKSASFSLMQNNIKSTQNLLRTQSNQLSFQNHSKMQLYKGKENRREGLLSAYPSKQQQQQFNGQQQTQIYTGNETQRQFNNRQSIDSFLDVTTKNIPQTFISQEKQTKLSIQHKNKSHRRNCNCDNDENMMESCSKVYSWLGINKELSQVNSTIFLSSMPLDFDPKIQLQIQKDVLRTYQNYEFFWNPQIQQSIQNILYKYINQYPEVGYVQGMNLIVGYLIWHADETYAFELLSKICSILNLNDLLKPGFPDLQKHLKTIEVIMIINCPQIYQILNKYDLHPSMFISEWILVLLTDIIPLEYSVNMLNQIINIRQIIIFNKSTQFCRECLKMAGYFFTGLQLTQQKYCLENQKIQRTKAKYFTFSNQLDLDKKNIKLTGIRYLQHKNHIQLTNLLKIYKPIQNPTILNEYQYPSKQAINQLTFQQIIKTQNFLYNQQNQQSSSSSQQQQLQQYILKKILIRQFQLLNLFYRVKKQLLFISQYISLQFIFHFAQLQIIIKKTLCEFDLQINLIKIKRIKKFAIIFYLQILINFIFFYFLQNFLNYQQRLQ